MAEIIDLEQDYSKARAMADKLPQTILAKAFQGEFVHQDPNDDQQRITLSLST